MKQKKALVMGAGGFIGSHLVKDLKKQGFWVKGVDLKYPEFSKSEADNFTIGDLRSQETCDLVFGNTKWDEVYQCAADMGGALFVFTGINDADIIHNSALINLNVVERCVRNKVGKVFFSSSACVYPEEIQAELSSPPLKEEDAYPANPDSDYGWEKLFSERLYQAYHRNHGLNIRIARFHNIYGPEGTWKGGREKAPAAVCRKVIESDGVVEIWGDGEQRRSFLYIDECLKGVRKLMDSDVVEPLNIGSDEQFSINELVGIVAISCAHKEVSIKNVKSTALGVRGRNSDNVKIKELLGWAPDYPFGIGIQKTYDWIKGQVKNDKS